MLLHGQVFILNEHKPTINKPICEYVYFLILSLMI